MRIAYRMGSRPDAICLRIEVGLNVEGHCRTDANQQSPHLVAPNGAAGLVPVDSPITPVSAINNIVSTPPGVPGR
jgi:hypothetical protein